VLNSSAGGDSWISSGTVKLVSVIFSYSEGYISPSSIKSIPLEVVTLRYSPPLKSALSLGPE
jgi:hypothetical protein